MRKKVELMILAVFTGIFHSLVFINPLEKEVAIGEVFLQLSGSRGRFSLGYSIAELLCFFLCLMPGLLLLFFLGLRLYGHFCTASIYVFCRYTKRIVWYRKVVLSLIREIVLFQITFLITILLCSELRFNLYWMEQDEKIIIFHFLSFLLWNLLWIMVMNLISMEKGSSQGILFVMGIQMGMLGCLSLINNLNRQGVEIEIIHGLIRSNPISVLVTGWHKLGPLTEENIGNRTFLSPIVSLGILWIATLTVLIYGGIRVAKKEIIVENMEWREG